MARKPKTPEQVADSADPSTPTENKGAPESAEPQPPQKRPRKHPSKHRGARGGKRTARTKRPGAAGLPPSITPAAASSPVDTRLIERAVRERWPIPEQFRAPLINRQIKIAIDPNSSAKEAILSFRSILAAEAQNQADQHHLTGETIHIEQQPKILEIVVHSREELTGIKTVEQIQKVLGHTNGSANGNGKTGGK